jgi:hypothetical protein
VSYAPQSSPGLLRLPACALAVCLVLATPAAAQEEQALVEPASLHREPEGTPLVSLPAGVEVETGRRRGAWHQATVEGWIFTASTRRTRQGGFDLVVTPDGGENLRASPNGDVVGRVREGTLLKRLGQKGAWTHVRRRGWIPRDAIAKPAPRVQQQAASQGRGAPAKSAAKPAPPSAPAPPAPEPAAAERVQTSRQITLGAGPEGGTLGTLESGAPAQVVARSGDRVKVLVEGWLPADAVTTSEGGALVGVSAAEVRTQPDKFVGQTVEWRLQVIAVQRADELRGEMSPGQPYLLTRGPLPEPGFVYVTIPADRIADFQALPPLHEVVLRVSIRAARTKFLATPVAELVSVVSGMDGRRATP